MPELEKGAIVGAQTLVTCTFVKEAGADGKGIHFILGAPPGAAAKKLVSRYLDR